ncbi:carboxypeptidase-like regulatory domain-containing protein [Sphingobacterium sp. KU25419]|nr:carboxypeptidase-like regulatory domain-containing protein [Sphingobacterium sp. KU25419]
MPKTKYTTAEILISGALFGIGTNLTTYAIIAGQEVPTYVYSNLALSLRLPGQLLVTPQLQYEYNHNKIIALRCEIGKYVFRKGYINLSCEQNFKSKFSTVAIGLRYDFSFSQVGFSAIQSNSATTLVQSARGSIIYDGKSGTLDMSNRSSVGTGGITILPYLDLNRNGIRDAEEPKVNGLLIDLNGGCIVKDKRDSTIRILNLEPFSNYFIDMSRNHFENISWQIKNKTVSVLVEPNRIKHVEVAVWVMGEVSGTVYLKAEKEQTALARISVSFYKNDTLQVAHVLSEADGFFSFTGLGPGNYTAIIDPAQLHKLGMISVPLTVPFHISENKDGDVVDELKFVLQRLPAKGR